MCAPAAASLPSTWYIGAGNTEKLFLSEAPPKKLYQERLSPKNLFVA